MEMAEPEDGNEGNPTKTHKYQYWRAANIDVLYYCIARVYYKSSENGILRIHVNQNGYILGLLKQ